MEKLTEYNNKLLGAPSGVLLFLFIILFGYALKSLKKIPNNFIPINLIIIGMAIWMLVCPGAKDEGFRNWLGRNILIGGIIPCCSWIVHRTVLKRIIAKLTGNGKEDIGFDSSPDNQFKKEPNEKNTPTPPTGG